MSNDTAKSVDLDKLKELAIEHGCFEQDAVEISPTLSILGPWDACDECEARATAD